MLFPLIGAGLGGFEGYRRSGGDLGATLLGAGLGAVTPAGLRMAGTALGGTALGAGVLGKATSLGGKVMSGPIGAQAAKLGVGLPVGPMAPLTAATLGGLAAGTGVALGAPALAGVLAAGAAKPLGKAARAASGAVGLGSQATGIGQPDLPNVPGYSAEQLTPGQLNQYGPPGAAAYADPLGSIQSQLRFEQQQYMQSLQNALRYAPYQEAYQQRSKEADLIRGAKAAQLATALSTDAAMRQQGQLGAQRMSEGFLGNIGQAGATQYRYF
jgi:hypothetical protein